MSHELCWHDEMMFMSFVIAVGVESIPRWWYWFLYWFFSHVALYLKGAVGSLDKDSSLNFVRIHTFDHTMPLYHSIDGLVHGKLKLVSLMLLGLLIEKAIVCEWSAHTVVVHYSGDPTVVDVIRMLVAFPPRGSVNDTVHHHCRFVNGVGERVHHDGVERFEWSVDYCLLECWVMLKSSNDWSDQCLKKIDHSIPHSQWLFVDMIVTMMMLKMKGKYSHLDFLRN